MTSIALTQLGKRTEASWPVAAWLPLAVLPIMTAGLTAAAASWIRMWALAISIYGSLKWLTFAVSPAARQATFARAAGYLFLWTGMDAEAFFRESKAPLRTRWSEWIWSLGHMALGAWILIDVAPR